MGSNVIVNALHSYGRIPNVTRDFIQTTPILR